MNADEMAKEIRFLWALRGYPEAEYAQAVAQAGTLDRLHGWFMKTQAWNAENARRLQVTALIHSVKEVIQREKAAFDEGKPSKTALDLSRELSLPLEVVLYVAAGEPRIDTFQRPWL